MIREELKDIIEIAIRNEKAYADKEHGDIKSFHEGYALLLEENDEAALQGERLHDEMERCWEDVKKNSQPSRIDARCDEIIFETKLLISELIQVCAVAQRIKEHAERQDDDGE